MELAAHRAREQKREREKHLAFTLLQSPKKHRGGLRGRGASDTPHGPGKKRERERERSETWIDMHHCWPRSLSLGLLGGAACNLSVRAREERKHKCVGWQTAAGGVAVARPSKHGQDAWRS